MEPVVQEVENTKPFAFNAAPPFSGIKAIPSRDDSDGETFPLSDSVTPNKLANEGFSSSISTSSDSEKAEEESMDGKEVPAEEILVKPIGNVEIGEPLGDAAQEFLTPRAGVPIAKISADDDEDDGEEEDENGSFSTDGSSYGVENPPKVRALRGEDVEGDDDDFRTAVTASRNAQGVKFDDLVTETDKKLEGVEEEADNLGDKGGMDESKTETLEDSSQVSPVVDEPSLTNSEFSERNGFEFSSEGDAIVDSIKVDPTEAVRSGVIVIGEVVESKDSEGEVVKKSAVEDEDPTITDSKDVEVVNDKPTNDGDLFEDSLDVDVTEAKNGGVADAEVSEAKEAEVSVDEENSALPQSEVDVTDNTEAAAVVAGEEEETQNSEAKLEDAQVLQKPDSAEVFIDEDNSASAQAEVDVTDKILATVVVAGEEEEAQSSEAKLDDAQVLEKSDLANVDAGEADGAKVTNQEDSLVDKISFDATETIQSGAVVVGELEGTKDVEAKENAFAADENIGAGLESIKHDLDTMDAVAGQRKSIASQEDSVVDKINIDIVEAIRSRAAIVGEHEEWNGTEVKENGSAAEESIDAGHEFYQHGFDTMDDDVVAQEKISGSAENLAADNTLAGPEASSEGPKSEVPEQSDLNVNVISARDGENALEVRARDDTVKANDEGLDNLHLSESKEEGEAVSSGVIAEAENDGKPDTDEEDVNGSTDDETDGLVFGSSAAARQFMQELERASGAGSQVNPGSSHEHSREIDGQIVTDSEEEADSDNEQDGQELFDSAALAALLKAATNASVDPGNLTITSQDGTRLFSVERPAGLGSSLRSVRPSAARPNNSMFTSPGAPAVSEQSLSEEERNKLEKLQQLRVKFLRLVYRLGHSAEDSVATQVLYRLALVAGRPSVHSFSLDVAKQTALKLEVEGTDDLNLSLNILVLGKSGVGKSATINSIFGEEKVNISAFEPGTTTVNEITGVVSGVNVHVFDTPGLRTSALEQGFNRKVLASVKKFTKKSPPDIVLYVDRLDSQTKDLNDLPLLRTITSTLGSSIWKNAIVTLTHAACAPPDGPSGSPLSYEVFVAQRSHIVQQYVGQAVGDFRLMSPGMMNPVSLVENHLNCRKNREGQKVLPNGQTWKPQLMLLCFSMKILSDASSVSKASESQDHRKLFGFRVRSPPLPYLLSSLLQPRPHPKLSADQGGDNGDSDIELDDFSDLEREEEEDEYDQLPPFKPLRKAQIARLSKEQRKAYLEEYDYRVKLLQKKQWKEELKRMRDAKNNKGATNLDEYGQTQEDYDQENDTPAAVPVPLPDMALPPTFDGDNPAYRYRFLEPTSQFLARPVLDTHGWDHDCGYDGVNVEQNLGIVGRFPAAVTVQVTKDKKDFNLHLDSSVSAKHGENGSSLVGFDVQNIGKQLGYIVRGETKFKNLKKNKTAAGVSVTFLGENVATGVKVEDQISVGKRLVFIGSTGTVRSEKDAAYGANLEVRLRDADYPIGQDQSSFMLSLMKWRGDLAVGGNLQSQISVGRNSKVNVRVALNNKLSGQITVRTSSSDHLQLALFGLVPIALSIFRSFKPGVSENYPIY